MDPDLNYNRRQFWPYKRLYGAGKTIKQSKNNTNTNTNTNTSTNTNTNTKHTKKIFHLVNNKIATDHELINRLGSLYIPPAYKDIIVAKSANNKIQAIGTDKRGRRQYIYNNSFKHFYF